MFEAQQFSEAPPSRTAIVILAAGASSRMGSPKQLLDFRGLPLIRHAAITALESGCGPVVVVLGSRGSEISPALDGLPVSIAHNPRWAEGMGTSIQIGLKAVEQFDCDGLILTLADQPFITATYLQALVGAHRKTGKPIVAASYAGTFGVPAFFAQLAWPLLAAVGPGEGCKGVLSRHENFRALLDCPAGAADIDTPADYAALR